MQHYNTHHDLLKHEEYCWENSPENIIMPEVETVKGQTRLPEIKLKNHLHRERVPFVVYADFEALIEPIQSCEPDPKKSFTNQFQKHKPCGFCYHIKCFDEIIYPSKTVLYRMKNEDVSQIFVDMLEKDIKKIHEEFDFSEKMIMTDADMIVFEKATTYWICGLPFKEKQKKVRDHCHFTGKY